MTYEPTLLDLFSGIGGFSLAFESEGFRTVGFSETDEDAGRVLEHHWPDVQNFGDIRNVGRGILDEIGPVDVITGGVPCQPASALGQMRGTADERWLWPEAIRVVGEMRPRVAMFENPPSLLRLEDGRAWDGIVNGLAALGYDCLWEIVPAAIVGAGHIRERVYLLAMDSYSNGGGRGAGREGRSSGDSFGTAEQSLRLDASNTEGEQMGSAGLARENGHVEPPDCDGIRRDKGTGLREVEEGERWGRFNNLHGEGIATSSDSHGSRLQRHAGHETSNGGRQRRARSPIVTPDLRGRVSCENWWHEDVTGIPVLVHGLSSKLDEASCRCTGNAVVPAVVQIFARAIREHLNRL